MHRILLSLFLLVIVQCGPPAPLATGGQAAARAQPCPAAPALAGPAASFRIANDGRGPLGPRVVTFGQVFPQGAVRRDAGLNVSLDGQPARAQMDAKAFYCDGSVRHAVVSVQTPTVRGGAALKGVIEPGAAPAQPAAAPEPGAPAVTAEITFEAGPDKGRTVTVDLPALVRSAKPREGKPWLDGPLVREERYASALVDGLQVVFDVRTPVVGPALVDVVFHNDAAQNATIGTLVYDARLTLDGRQVFRADNLGHYAYANWRWQIYADGAPPPRVVPDTRRLMALGAAPRYARVRPDPSAMDKLHAVAVANGYPLGFGSITPYMPTTGGRPDIGPLPTWAVFYLLDPSRENHETLFANADVAGSVPWHVRDLRTGGPIRIDQHPDVWLDGRGEAVPGILERKFYWLDTKWQPDDAHQPSLTYLPYLLTGSRYYRDELAMQAAYVLLAIDPRYREGASGFLLGSQVRAVAWDLRTLANAAYILPSDDPLQPYFQGKAEANLREIIRRYVHGHELDEAGELKGYIPGPYAVETATPPWQNDYLAIVLGWMHDMGFADARQVLGWMTNFVAGRFTSADRGYAPIYGTPYYLQVADPSSHQLIGSWSQAFKTTFNPKTPVTALDYPDWGGGYAALARASLASIINVTGSAQAKTAYAFVKAHTPGMDANYAKEPTFAITPTEADKPS
jgi:hypothetical protein